MNEIIFSFQDFINTNVNGDYSRVYIGISKDPVDRLEYGHGVTPDIPNIYWSSPLNTLLARDIEKYFLDRGCVGGPGGGNILTCFVYAYVITPKTRQ